MEARPQPCATRTLTNGVHNWAPADYCLAGGGVRASQPSKKAEECLPPRHQGSGGDRTGSATPIPPTLGRTSRYTELEGAQGRDVYFRPERYPRSELGSIGVAVEVLHAGVLQRCELRDVSQSGFAFEWPRDTLPEVGSTLEEVTLRFDGHEAYRGRARVSSIRRLD